MIDIQFDGQKKNEKVVAVYHINILHFIRSILIAMLCVIIPVLITIFFGVHSFTIMLYVIFIGLFFTHLFRIWYLWRNNMFLITNIRVIALTQEGFFDRKLRESYLESICLVNAYVKGVLHTTFNYGRVLVQTEAEMWLDDVERPYEVKDAIFSAIRDFKTSGNQPKEIISEEL